MENNKGFTLLELMIAVAIMGLLTAVAFPAYRDYVGAAYGAGAKKGVANQANKALTCVLSGIGCDVVAADIVAIDELSLSAGGPLADSVGGTISWDNGECFASATITDSGILTYSATNSATGSTTEAQCQAGAGL